MSENRIITVHKVCIDDMLFCEGRDIAFTRDNTRYIGEIKRILPKINNHPAALLLHKMESKQKNATSFEPSDPDTVHYFELDKLSDVDYVYVD